MEEITRSGRNAGRCHGQMYNMNTLLRNGSEAQKKKYLPKSHGELRLQSMGVTEPTAGTDTTSIKTVAVKRATATWSTARSLDVAPASIRADDLLARTTPLDKVKKNPEGMSIFLVDTRARA